MRAGGEFERVNVDLFARWLKRAEDELALAAGKPDVPRVKLLDSRHADDLGFHWSMKGWRVAEAVDWFNPLLPVLQGCESQLTWALEITGSSSRWITDRPEIAQYKPRQVEPPSIYLFHKQYGAPWLGQEEEYRSGYPKREVPAEYRHLAWQFVSRRDPVSATRPKAGYANSLWAYGL